VFLSRTSIIVKKSQDFVEEIRRISIEDKKYCLRSKRFNNSLSQDQKTEDLNQESKK